MRNHSCLKYFVFIFSLALTSYGLSGCTSAPKSNLSAKEKSLMLIQVAAGAINEGDPTGALTVLFEAEELGNHSPELHHLKSLAFFFKKDLVTALKEARIAVKLNPNFAEANNTLGKLLLDLGNYSEAEKYLKNAAENPLYRDAYRAQTNLGMLHYKKGEFATAEKFFNDAIDSNPTLACVSYYYRGQIKINDAKFESALRDFDRATEKYCGSFEEAHFAIGMAYSKSKQFAKARKKFVEIRTLFPDTPTAEKAMEQLRFLP